MILIHKETAELMLVYKLISTQKLGILCGLWGDGYYTGAVISPSLIEREFEILGWL